MEYALTQTSIDKKPAHLRKSLISKDNFKLVPLKQKQARHDQDKASHLSRQTKVKSLLDQYKLK